MYNQDTENQINNQEKNHNRLNQRTAGMSRMDETIQAKTEKRKQLEKLGITTHPHLYNKQHTIAQARNLLNENVQTAGRILSVRAHGSVIFLDLQDSTDHIQVMVRKTEVPEKDFEWLKTLVDRGDYLGIVGTVITTKTGEITILAKEYTLLSKALRPIPTAWNSADSKEVRFRKRYIDILINPDTKRIMDARWLITKEIRRFLQDKYEFIEVETPILQPLYGGTNATPFTTHMNALDCNFYLRIAPELYLKRLIVGGYDKVFEIARNFRNEGIDQTHQPEFTMIEWYETYADYHRMMNVAEELVKHLVYQLYGNHTITVGNEQVDISGDWPRMRMDQALQQYASINFDSLTDSEVKYLLEKHKVTLKSEFTRGKALFELFDALVTPQLVAPIWIIDYPRDISPLAKQHRSNPIFAERFEAYIGGKELADGWSEIVDPLDQRRIFENEQANMRHGDTEAHPLDEDFLEAMEHGMPPLGGIGMGIDRLVMFLTNTWSIKEVIAFPTLRPINQVQITEKVTPNFTGEGIQPEVLQKFPGISYAQVIISGVNIKKTDSKLESAKQQVLESKVGISLEQISEIDTIQAYRNLFTATGTDAHKKRPSPEALLRRIAQGKNLYNINTAADAYNLAVIETGIGLGGFNADKLKLPVSLRFSQKGEKMLLLGDETETATRDYQLVYSDSEKPITIDLNYRDINETKLTEKTTTIALYADGAPGINSVRVVEALKKGAQYIQQYCGGTIGVIILYDENGKHIISEENQIPTPPNTQEKKQEANHLPSREQAENLLNEYIQDEALKNHCRMVAKAMGAYAKELGQNEELWYQTGLLHDLDWEKYPDEHPNRTINEILTQYPQEMLDAIAAHAPSRTGKHPQTLIERYLFACDEISGFMNAVSILRPEKFVGMTPKSVKKKLKTTQFAANVSRKDIAEGLELIGKSEDEHFSFLITVFNN